MRKGAAIFLLIIHFYNFIGYKAIFAYLDMQATDHLISRLDKGKYQQDELIEVKIPYQSLYAPNWSDYARFDGEIEINGSHYNLDRSEPSHQPGRYGRYGSARARDSPR